MLKVQRMMDNVTPCGRRKGEVSATRDVDDVSSRAIVGKMKMSINCH